ncbi:phospholipase [Herbaspirillum sp. HC18]|nr:phospholipase [Herbaspirillum sp. HC18]
MTSMLNATAESNGLTVKAYSGDRCVMLAFNLDDHLRADLAGFAVRRRFEQGPWKWLMNRLSFSSDYTDETTASDRKWFPTDEAPFQKFWWVDFPPEDDIGSFEYEVTVKRFTEPHSAKMRDDQSVKISIACSPFKQGNFELAFTRGYLSSQAYSDRFNNEPLRPKPKSMDYDTQPYQKKYEWLGAHAREAIIQFLERCHEGADATLDVMAYDLDEPDIIRALIALGSKVRIVMDNAPLHAGEKALEPSATAALRESAGTENVKIGHFRRYQHNKVFILRVNGKPQRVLTGSTNFSVTGLYVNANHVAIFDGEDVAGFYAQAFNAAFDGDMKADAFNKNPVSQQEFEIARAGLPRTIFSFAPHKKDTFSLDRLHKELESADSSVLFAVMALEGGSKVLDLLRSIGKDGKIFSYGITDNPGAESGGEKSPDGSIEAGVRVYSPSNPGVLVTSAALNKLVPPPFNDEREEGLAHKIHHKFVVIDFNDTEPVVFFGSSNLAKLGEEQNGDNLIAIYDRAVATVFAIEAIRLVDHYAFRSAIKKATKIKPLRLRFNDEDWAKGYFTEGHIKRRERLLFSR